MEEKSVRVGVVGCGSFALFALQQFVQVDGVELVGMAGTFQDAAARAAARFGIPDFGGVEDLVGRDDIDLVYVGTPPFLHYEQSIKALKAGKHVICEKPLALTLEQADEMLAAASERGLLMVTDLMQRYNPVFRQVRELIESRALGAVLHASFENYAADEGLPPDHWFWDREKSGGIFVEHGVHFFDLFAGWLGPGRVVAAQATCRPHTSLEEQVQCSVRYDGGVIGHFYHGFHQPWRMDRQETRILFERGDLRLHGWIPTSLSIHALADEAATRRLCEIFPDYRLDVTADYPPEKRACRGREKELDVAQMIRLTAGEGREEMHRYGELLRGMIADQVEWIRDSGHERIVTEENGREALAAALQADRLAHR